MTIQEDTGLITSTAALKGPQAAAIAKIVGDTFNKLLALHEWIHEGGGRRNFPNVVSHNSNKIAEYILRAYSN